MYLDLWTLYDHPRDFPRHIVARRHRIMHASHQGTIPAMIGGLYDSLAEARWDMEMLGLSGPLPRKPTDDPVIIETWL